MSIDHSHALSIAGAAARFATKAISMSCAALLATGSACAEGANAMFDFYGKLYPEWKVENFGQPSNKGTEVGTMGTLRNDRTTLSKDASRKDGTSDHDWSNSYVGVRGRFPAGALTLGYDWQGLIDLQGKPVDNIRSRDGYAYVEHPAAGRVQVGQMDSIYKQYGDRVRMLGVSSSNFVSTSKVLSGVAWRGQGETTFHNRRGSMLTWQSPVRSGFQVGASHSVDATQRVAGNADTLTAAALRWRQGNWYAAAATEIHRNWLPVSLDAADAVPAATSILNNPASTRSRDQAWRLSIGWFPKDWRIAADVARLRYTEDDSAGLPGKFRFYGTTTWQVSAEHRLSERWVVSANHARGAAGECRLSEGVPCSTLGLGGHLSSLGAMYEIDHEFSVFLLGQHVNNSPGGRYVSAPQGGTVNVLAAGVKYEFK